MDSYRALKGAFMYSKQQKEAALKLYKQSKSVSETVRILGYPTRKQLYNWVYEEKHPPKKRKKLTAVGNPPYHPRIHNSFNHFIHIGNISKFIYIYTNSYPYKLTCNFNILYNTCVIIYLSFF